MYKRNSNVKRNSILDFYSQDADVHLKLKYLTKDKLSN